MNGVERLQYPYRFLCVWKYAQKHSVLCSNGSLSATECFVSLNLMSIIVIYRVRLVLFCLENQTNDEKSDVIIPFYSATHSVRCSRMFGIS